LCHQRPELVASGFRSNKTTLNRDLTHENIL
jgi:hypothetical protein